MEQVTIRDIARKCKVGVSTVSRAMNNHPDINPETKECKVRLLGQISDCKADDANDKLYEGLRRLICAVIDDYGYLIMK